MKVKLNGKFSVEQLNEVMEFLKIQETTDRETETTGISYGGDYGNYDIKIKVDKWHDIELITIKLEEE